jgi:hypothetical protein
MTRFEVPTLNFPSAAKSDAGVTRISVKAKTRNMENTFLQSDQERKGEEQVEPIPGSEDKGTDCL